MYCKLYEFKIIDENSIKDYKAKFIRLPPQTSRNARVEEALANGIPIEYLVYQDIIQADNLNELNISQELKDMAIAYMLHIGKIKSPDEITRDTSVKKKKKENEVKARSKNEAEVVTKENEKEKELLAEIAELRSINKSLENEKEKISKQLVAERSKLEKDLSNEKNEKEKLEEENKELLAEIAELRSINESLETENKELVVERSKLEKDLSNVKNEKEKLETENKELVAEVEKLEMEKDELTAENKLLNTKLSEEIRKIQLESNKALEVSKEEINKLKEELKKAEEDKRSIIKKNSDNISSLEKEIERLKGEIVQKSNENISKLDEIISLKSENTKLKNEVIIKDEKIMALDIQIKSLNDARKNNTDVLEIQRLNREINNLTIIINEKSDEIRELKEKNMQLEEEIRNNTLKHMEEIAEIERINNLRLEEYRVRLAEKDLTSNDKVDNDTNGNSLDISRAKLEGKKIVSILGSRIYDISSYIENNEEIAIFEEADDADLYIILTDLTKKSVERFKEDVKAHKNSIKVMVNWDDSIPFSAESLTGCKLDVIIKNNPEWFKETWVNEYSVPSWVGELKSKISEKLGVHI